jgi:hypothetical protein
MAILECAYPARAACMPAVLVKVFAAVLRAAARLMDVKALITRPPRAHHIAQQGAIMVANVTSSATVALTRAIKMGVLALHSILTTAMECAQLVLISTVIAPALVAQTVDVKTTTATERTTVVRMAAGAQMGRSAAAIAISN